ncbi:MAG: hypothetical protein V1494_06675 [Candidatus Diapherotrites archaeon]
MKNKISYSELPANIQSAIDIILMHRRQLWDASKIALPTVTILALQGYYNKSILAASTATVGGAFLLRALRKHDKQFKKEGADLIKGLRNCKETPIKELVANYPFITVNILGDIVGKKHAPKIWFIPAGRRRFPTSYKLKTGKMPSAKPRVRR